MKSPLCALLLFTLVLSPLSGWALDSAKPKIFNVHVNIRGDQEIGADFADIFAVKDYDFALGDPLRAKPLPDPRPNEYDSERNQFLISDNSGLPLKTQVILSQLGDVHDSGVQYHLALSPRERWELHVEVIPLPDGERTRWSPYGFRLAGGHGARALLDLATENLANDGQREKMRHDQRQGAVLVELAQLIERADQRCAFARFLAGHLAQDVARPFRRHVRDHALSGTSGGNRRAERAGPPSSGVRPARATRPRSRNPFRPAACARCARAVAGS